MLAAITGFLTSGPVLVIGGLVIALIVIFVAMARVTRFIRKVPPNMALLVYGVRTKTKVTVIRRVRKLKQPSEESGLSSELTEPDDQEWEVETTSDEIEVNYRIIKGGMAIVLPVVHDVKKLDLSLMTIDVAVHNVLSKNAVPITTDGVVQIKIGSDDTAIATAAEQLLDKEPTDIRNIAIQTLQGHLRAIIGLMTVEEIYKDRETFAQRAIEVAVDDLAGMGLEIVSFTIKEIDDEVGYLDALGKPEIEDKKSLARIATAERDKEATEREQDAEKEKAGYTKDANVAKAQYDAETARERAIATRSEAISLAEQDKTLEEKQALAAEQAAIRREKELDKEVKRPADAKLYAAQQTADGTRAVGYADADVTKKTGEAEADANKAIGLAAADVTRAEGEAEGAAILAKLLGEAEGQLELAKSLNAYEEAALRLTLGRELLLGIPLVAESFGKAFANIDQIRLIEIGGGIPGAAGEGIVGSTERFLDMIPNTLFKFLQGATALLGSPIDDLIASTIIEEAEKRGVEMADDRKEAVKKAVVAKTAEAEAEAEEAEVEVAETEETEVPTEETEEAEVKAEVQKKPPSKKKTGPRKPKKGPRKT